MKHLVTILCVLVAACGDPTPTIESHDDELAHGADQIEIKTATGYFDEVAGREEETPECHPFHSQDKTCAPGSRQPADDIWEKCEDDEWLIETGPVFAGCHPHDKGVGHPFRVSCDEYCEGRYGDPGPQTYTGYCTTKKLPCGGGMQDIGYCECVALADLPTVEPELPSPTIGLD